MSLLDQYGNPITAEYRKRRRSPPPGDLVIGDTIGQWAGQNLMYLQVPGGSVLQFDLEKLTLDDFRQMRNNYQLSASLNVLTFMMHQLDWSIECDDSEIADMIETNLEARWTRLMRAVSQSFWAGYSPCALIYENNSQSGYLELSKIKDLIPEQCRVNWLWQEGTQLPGPGSMDTEHNIVTPASTNRIAPLIGSFDGIRHYPQTGLWGDGGHGPWLGGYGVTGTPVVIPPENSFWVPLLMENGDHYGRKLLKPAFPAYFFSQLIHLFANRYFERFGEPTPVGRANFEDEVEMGGTVMNGKRAMENILMSLRNRSVVVLPSDRDPDTKEYEYSLEFLESTMRGRGNDFEAYLSRLDEEMSLAVFTPILLFRTSAVGSYNLGDIHIKVFQEMLNSIAGDVQEYIQNYIVDRLRVFNFGESSPYARLEFRQLGKGDMQTYQLMMQALVTHGDALPDLEELSVATGITMNKVQQLVAPPTAPPDPNADPGTSSTTARRDLQILLDEAVTRVGRELANGWNSGHIKTSLGFRNRFATGLQRLGYDAEEAQTETDGFYGRVNRVLGEMTSVASSFSGPEELRDALGRVVEHEFTRFTDPPATISPGPTSPRRRRRHAGV